MSVDEDGLSYEHAHGKGDVAVRGPVTHLLLAAYGRGPGARRRPRALRESSDWARLTDVVSLG